MASPPPLLWQSEIHRDVLSDSQSREAARRFHTTESIAEAYRNVTEVAQSRRDADLHDLLSNARKEDTYQSYISGWPSLLRPLSPTLMELPAMVQEKFRACQTMCFCGLFPQLRRAWASIDNCLYLWRYDVSGDVPVECGGVDQAICSVGLARPTPGVFSPGIQHVLVLCTPVEVMLLGVSSIARGVGGEDLSVQPLPRYSVPSDNVVMTCVSTTAAGRIFLGGADGHVYELCYGVADTWRSKKCSKVRITGSLQQYLPGFVPAYIFGLRPPSPIETLCVDDERSILYALAQSSSIQVFDLGASGRDAARRVAEVADFVVAAAAATTGGRDVFRGTGGGDRKGAAVRHLAPIAVSESTKLHLLAVTADGRRVYFTTRANLAPLNPGGYGAAAGGKPSGSESSRPAALTAIHARSALPHAGTALGRIAAADLNRSVASEVVCALYAHGCLLLSEASGGDGRTTRLQLASRNNLLLPSPGVNTGASNGSLGLRELITELDNYIPGQTCAMCAAPPAVSLGPEVQVSVQEELAGQLYSSPPRFVLISTAGVVELEKRRPLDVLTALLQDRGADRLRQFFEMVGRSEAAAMCWALASARPGAVPATVAREASAALDDAALVGEPRMPEDLLAGPAANGVADSTRGGGTGPGIYMGRAVNPNPEPDWSAAHKGLCAYVLRLLQPAWEQPLLVPSKANADILHLRISTTTMAVIHDRLQCLDAFLGDVLARHQQRGRVRYSNTAASAAIGGASRGGGLFAGLSGGEQGGQADGRVSDASKRQRLTHAAVLEDERTARTRALVSKAGEALALLRILHDFNVGRLALRLNDASLRTLKNMALRDMVCDAEGEAVVAQLISVLITQQLDALAPAAGSASAATTIPGSMEAVAEMLQAQCPTYFKDEDRIFYQASAKLKAAQSVASSAVLERDRLVREAVVQYLRVPLACDLEYVTAQLAYLKHYEGIVEIPLAAAAAHDPGNMAMRPDMPAEYERARQKRCACYQHILQALRDVSGAGSKMASGERAACQAAIFKCAAQSTDVFFHDVLYGALFEMGATDELLCGYTGKPWPFLEEYLQREGGLKDDSPADAMATGGEAAGGLGPRTRRQVALLELLARILIGKRRFREAAAVHAALASRRSGGGETAVSLEERVAAYQMAVLQAKSEGDSQLVSRLEADAKVAGFQRSIASQLQERIAAAQQAGSSTADLTRALGELQANLLSVSELYNDYAQPLRMWGSCLQLVDFAGGEVEAASIRLLWDHALLQAWEAAPRLSPHGVRLKSAADCAEELGAQFYPSETSFPTNHVVWRLEQMAARVWPASSSTAGDAGGGAEEQQWDESAVPLALARACRGSFVAAQRTYELLLSRRASGIPNEALLMVPRMRTQLLTSLRVLARAQLQVVQSSAGSVGLYPGGPFGREAAYLADWCDKYALEARRLGGPACDALAKEFDEIKQCLAVHS